MRHSFMNYNPPEMLHTVLQDKEIIVDLAQLPCLFVFSSILSTVEKSGGRGVETALVRLDSQAGDLSTPISLTLANKKQ